jgi:hypothetical protein
VSNNINTAGKLLQGQRLNANLGSWDWDQKKAPDDNVEEAKHAIYTSTPINYGQMFLQLEDSVDVVRT